MNPLDGPRALVFGLLFGIVFWAVLLFGVCTVSNGIRPLGSLP